MEGGGGGGRRGGGRREGGKDRGEGVWPYWVMCLCLFIVCKQDVDHLL